MHINTDANKSYKTFIFNSTPKTIHLIQGPDDFHLKLWHLPYSLDFISTFPLEQ